MKTIFALLALLAAPAYAADTASCRLEQLNYSTKNYVDYKFEGSQTLSQKTVRLMGHVDMMEDSIYPISYSVAVSGGFAGHLCIKIDQPGPCDSLSTADIHDPFQLMVEDYYNGGKTEYRLLCQAD